MCHGDGYLVETLKLLGAKVVPFKKLVPPHCVHFD